MPYPLISDLTKLWAKRKRLREMASYWETHALHPGDICPISGQWVGPDGNQVTCNVGDPMPPGKHGGWNWRLTDYTRRSN